MFMEYYQTVKMNQSPASDGGIRRQAHSHPSQVYIRRRVLDIGLGFGRVGYRSQRRKVIFFSSTDPSCG